MTNILDNLEADAWISTIMCIGPEYGKRLYGKLPVQSIQPGYYSHSKLYSQETIEGALAPGILHAISLLKMRQSDAPNIVEAIAELEKILAGSIWIEGEPSRAWMRAAEIAGAGYSSDELRRMAEGEK
jgi:hypothetical protein